MTAKNPPPCDTCQAKCCRYIATGIDTPEDDNDRDNIRWYLFHKNVHVFRGHDQNWYVEFATDCEKLDVNHRCSIYEERPEICRGHGDGEAGCEATGDPYDLFFSNADDFMAWWDSLPDVEE